MPKKQKDNRYRAKVTVAGKPVWVSAKTTKELEAKKAAVRAELRDGVNAKNDITFHDLVIEWFEVFKKPHIKTPSTLDQYTNIINKHVLPCFPKNKLARAVRRADVQRCMDKLAGRCETTIDKTYAVINRSLEYAVSESILPFNPAAGVIKPDAASAKEKAALTDEQTQAIFRASDASPYGPMIYTLYYLGLRVGEMLGLQWGDFDWTRQAVHVQRDVDFHSKKRSGTLVGDLKTAAADRWVPVPDALKAMLYHLRSLPQLFVFSKNDGSPFGYNEFKLIFLKILYDANLAKYSDEYLKRHDAAISVGKSIPKPTLTSYIYIITPHWFRHNYISICVESGLPAEVTMRLVGHTDYKTTINIYTHISEKKKQDSVDLLNDVFQKKSCRKVAKT